MAELDELRHFNQASSRLKIALALVGVIMVVEVVGGIISGSLALLGDAGHMLVDILALSMSIMAMRIARRPVTATKTFGYHRVEIIAALANGIILFMTTAAILYEAYQRLFSPPEVKTTLMLVVAVVGLVANLVGIRLLRVASHGNLNVKSAFWHVVGDTISSAGVIVAGLIIMFTGINIVDPIVAIFIAIIILWGAVRVVRESTDILLESVPRHIAMDTVMERIRTVPGVRDLHDVHIWTITSGMYALSAHLLIEDQMVSLNAEIVRNVNQDLAENFNITHTTLQIECETCESCVCNIIREHTD